MEKNRTENNGKKERKIWCLVRGISIKKNEKRKKSENEDEMKEEEGRGEWIIEK